MSAIPARHLLSIGDVLNALRDQFPDVTISKIRFLESEGLVAPMRTASGYRKFSPDDVDRLRFVLSAQRDRYLPLKVIREELDALDRGLEPTPSGTRVPRTLSIAEPMPSAQDMVINRPDLRLSRQELVTEADIDEDLLDRLLEYGLVSTMPGTTYFNATALSVCQTVRELTGFGMEARHLRAFKVAADREVGLVSQVVTPMARQRQGEGRSRAEDVARQLGALSVRLHTALVQDGLAREMRG